jgi:hypothetical protein
MLSMFVSMRVWQHPSSHPKKAYRLRDQVLKDGFSLSAQPDDMCQEQGLEAAMLAEGIWILRLQTNRE